METMFYDQWALSGESSVSKPRGTFVPKWEDVQSDPEPDLRELLAWKKKRKEAPAAESDDTPQYVTVWGPDGRIMYKLWRCVGPTSEIQAGPTREWQHGSLACYVAQESLKKEEERDGEVVAEKDAQVVAEEELEEVDLGFGS